MYEWLDEKGRRNKSGALSRDSRPEQQSQVLGDYLNSLARLCVFLLSQRVRPLVE